MAVVSQSTVQQWENGRNVPSLENLEKIARLKGMLVEDFIAYLYGRSHGPTQENILARLEVMQLEELSQVLYLIGDRIALPDRVIVDKGEGQDHRGVGRTLR
ncbi:helix-turn-helix transcriptional regulator [Leptothoe spongobia]|uniref:Helix-turn-helix transcriptional regulator n=1 Tax=Leptothoe spongobia TAU-MAC 1115 TaxID=1967444 RepID=A0A947DJH8_9CYAN|nr:helix-turn-helix transcriptional regulator [Leptothoe spongobia]MBT9317339.1 helix-turn-helix transcriptional regulator [Leptothoe spongobia TAU-MAC 1115]